MTTMDAIGWIILWTIAATGLGLILGPIIRGED